MGPAPKITQPSTVNVRLARTPDGQVFLPSATVMPSGKNRFLQRLAPGWDTEGDIGINYMVAREGLNDGYERITRDIIDAYMRPGGLFIDAGAHWGIMTLSALTGPSADGARAIAIEPHPKNCANLYLSIAANHLADRVEIVPAAAASTPGHGMLVTNTSMGHWFAPNLGVGTVPGDQVPCVPIDMLTSQSKYLNRPTVLKVDVEGSEPDVIFGARQTIRAGNVDLIVWERAHHYRENADARAAVDRVLAWLSRLGYTHWMLPYAEWGGALLPLTGDAFIGNVFSFRQDIYIQRFWPQDFTKRPPFNPHYRPEYSPARHAKVAAMCAEANSADGIRWADPDQLMGGSEARAVAAMGFIQPRSWVVDIGAGDMSLRDYIDKSCAYSTVDLIHRSPLTRLADLNKLGALEATEPSVFGGNTAVLLEVLEYLHHPADVLMWLKGGNIKSLVLSYSPSNGVATQGRRERGFVNDMTKDHLLDILKATGWNPTTMVDGPIGEIMLACERP